jgi:hypothetical protein
MGENFAFGQGNGHYMGRFVYAYLKFTEINARFDDTVVGDDETFGGKGDFPTIEVYLILEFSHVSVKIFHRYQFLNGAKLLAKEFTGNDGSGGFPADAGAENKDKEQDDA